MRNIGLLTADILSPDTVQDDHLFVVALEKFNVKSNAIVWDQIEDIDKMYKDYEKILVRTTWDYCSKIDLFLATLQKIQAQSPASSVRFLANSYQTLLWNHHKSYLKDLEKAGVPLPNTLFVDAGTIIDEESLIQFLSNICSSSEQWVIKPVIGAGGVNTFIVDRSYLAPKKQEALFTLFQPLFNHAIIVQEFLPSIKDGERSLIFFSGEFSHGVKKVPTQNEFRCQEEHGGHLSRFFPGPLELEFAQEVIQKALPFCGNEVPLYARVDYLPAPLCLMELELIEPALYFQYAPEQGKVFAQKIMQDLDRTF